MSEKAILSLDKNNIPGPLEGGQTFPPASHQEVGMGSAQRENRGEGEQPEPKFIEDLYLLPRDSPRSNTNSPYFLDHKEIEGDEDLDSDKYPLPASEDAEPTLSRLVTGSNSTFGLSSDCREWTQVEPMMFVPSVGNKLFKKKVLLRE